MNIFRRRQEKQAPDSGGPPGSLPWVPRTDDAGIRIVDAIGYSLSLDEEWCVRDERGFTWWGKDLAQRVWAESGVDDGGFEIFRLHARTDLFRDFDPTDENLAKLNLFAVFATTNGFLVDPEAGTVQLAASMYAHDEIEVWVRGCFQSVVAIQAADAQIKADSLAKEMGFVAAASAHPSSGVRPNYDDMLYVLEAFVERGQQRSAWQGESMEETTRMLQNSPFFASGDSTALSVEFPFQSSTSLLTVTTGESNPQLGNGVLLRLVPPIRFEEAEGVRFATELTRHELQSMTMAHYLGGWCWLGEDLNYVTFLPNAMHSDSGDLLNMVMSAAVRSNWIAETFFGND